ncbi:MAG: hypothetical protein IPL65_10870 [Lewinellaceae bacterium]|nr:hypothetical protein [Lewinellaceae bacterium]
MERINWIRIVNHLSFWVVYLVLNAFLTCILHQSPIPESLPQALFGEAFVLPVKIALTYFVFYYILPLYLERDKLAKLVGLTLLAFTVSIVVYRLIIAYVYFPLFDPGTQIQVFFGPGIYLTSFDCFITVAAATTVKAADPPLRRDQSYPRLY